MNLTDNPLLKTIVESAPIGICILNAEDFVVEMLNDKFVEIAGKPKDTMLGKWYWEPFAEAKDYYEEALFSVVLSKKPFHANEVPLTLIRFGKNELIYVTFVYAPVVDENGKVTKVAIWVLENTTQVREREKVAAVNAELAQERDRLNQYFLQAPVAISVLSGEQLNIEFVNPNYQAMLPGRNLLGRPFFEALPEVEGSEVADALRSVYAKGVPVTFKDRLVPISAEEAGPTQERYFDFSYVPRFDNDGKVDGIFNFAFEVTSFVHIRHAEKQASNNLELILDMLPASVVVIRGDDLVVEVINNSNLAYWQRTREEVVGKPFLEILPDLADQPFAGQLRQVMATGEVIDVKESPVIFKQPDGTLRETYVDYTYQPLSDISGNRNGVLVMSFEITDRVIARTQLEQYARELLTLNDQLAKSESRFKFLIQEAPVAIGVLHGRELLVETANDKILEVWGKTRAIIGKPLSIALPELLQGDQPFLGILDEVFSSGKPFYANEMRALLEHGGELREIFFNVVYQPISDLKDAVADILVVAVDVTEQVNARKSTEEVNHRLQIALDASSLGSTEVQIATKVMKSSDQFKKNFGYLPEEDFNYDDLFESIFPEHRDRVRGLVREAMLNNSVYKAEYPIKWRDGSVHWIRAHGRPRYNEQGKADRMVGMTADITESKLFEQRREDFLSIASHEFKTPVTSLKAAIQLLDRIKDRPFTPMHTKLIEQAAKSVEKMSVLVDELLNMNRISQDQLQLECNDFSLYDMLLVSSDHTRVEGKYQLVLTGNQQLMVNADEHRIDQVVVNFINNAIKYASDSKEIHLHVERVGDTAKVSVTDFGPGIAEQVLPDLFDRYYRVDHSGKEYKGLGLGLYICSEIIKKHGGEIGVESTLGKGSTFWFTLPL